MKTLASIWLLALLGSALTVGALPTQHLEHALLAPGPEHWLGTDAFGRDLWGVLRVGIAHSLLLVMLVAPTTLALGVALGGAMGLSRGRMRGLAERTLDFSMAFPSLLLVIACQAIWGPGRGTLVLALIAGSLPWWTRMVMSRAREIVQEDYVQASLALGATEASILRRHLWPALRELVALKVPLLVSGVIFSESIATFLNLGAPAGAVTWGALLAHGKDYLIEAPHIAWFAGLPLFFTLLALHALSDTKGHVASR